MSRGASPERLAVLRQLAIAANNARTSAGRHAARAWRRANKAYFDSLETLGVYQDPQHPFWAATFPDRGAAK